jgi:hypothetical protein
MCQTDCVLHNVLHDPRSVIVTDKQVTDSMKMLRNTFVTSRGQKLVFQQQERQLGNYMAKKQLASRLSEY